MPLQLEFLEMLERHSLFCWQILCRFSEKFFVGVNDLFKGVDFSDYTPVRFHNVYFSSNLVSACGPVTLDIRPSLNFDGVHLLLENDLAGDKVVINPCY